MGCSAETESNLQPIDPESDAFTTLPRRQLLYSEGNHGTNL